MISTGKRFWSKVDVRGPEECWEWQACCLLDGYGRFGIADAVLLAHRVAWTLTHGTIPEGMDVCHRCDNPPCVNSSHLFLGTQADNMADAVKKGRIASPKGESNPASKLTKADVIEIRIRYKAGGVSQEKLGLEFGIHQTNIGLIVSGKTWKHLLEGKDAEDE